MTVEVIDVSSNNAHPINWQAAKASGVVGVVIKLTEGGGASSYVNPYALGDIAGAKAAGLAIAGYHFVHVDLSVGLQVALIRAHLDALDYVFVDSETAEATWVGTGSLTHEMCTALEAFVDTGLYSNPNFIENMPGAPWGVDLWLAEYGPKMTVPGALLWQYTNVGTVPGISGQIDRSHFYGTAAELAALFGNRPAPRPTPIPKPPTPPEDEVTTHDVVVQIASNGMGDTATDIPFVKVVSVTPQFGLGPKVQQNPGSAGFTQQGTTALITAAGWAPGTSLTVRVAESA